MKRHLCFSAILLCAGFGIGQASAQLVIFEEDFDSLLPTLSGSVNERVGTSISTLVASAPDSTPVPGVYSATAPGWTVDNTLSTFNGGSTVTPGVAGAGVADYGVDEWEGWSFVNKDFWSEAAEGQDRELFGDTSGAAGTVAVVDPDEYYDLGDPDDAVNGGYYSSSMTSSSFSVSAGGFYGLGFDSSWRDEAADDDAPGGFTNANNQSVEVIATFDVGAPVQVALWDSDDDATVPFKDDNADEVFPADGSKLFFEAPAGASTATLTFSIANAGNDWWWAVDNIEVNDLVGSEGTVFSEDFEGVTLGDSVNERLSTSDKVTIDSSGVNTIVGVDYATEPRPDSFTHTPPTGFTVDNTGTPNVGDEASNDIGVFEYEQWAFVTPEFWQFTDEQGREDFTNGTGVIAVADGDEWDDLGDPGDNGDLTTFFQTPEIDLSTAPQGGKLVVSFDSSWRDEDSQTAVVTAIVDGVPVEIIRWDSDSASPFFHDDNTNEMVRVDLDHLGASTLSLQFSYVGNNDWWWAVDNIRVTHVPEPASVAIMAIGVFGLWGRRRW